MAPKIQNKITKAQMRLITTAKNAGLPSDALRNFVSAGYCPQPKQIDFHVAARECDKPNGPDQVGFGGARGPGKSHALFAQAALDDCQRFEGLKVLYLRKVAKNAREQFYDLRRSVLKNVKHTYSEFKGLISFPTESRIFIGHFRNEKDIDQYLGLEYDIIIIEEATTLTLTKYKALRDSNRTSKEGFRPRIYTSTNPGNVGHAWFKKRFIIPAREHQETETRFIFATVEDNAFLDENYVKHLEDNTGWKLQAHRFGDWDIAAGQFFTTYRWDLHTFPSDEVALMPGATYWASLDYGFNHYTVCHLFMKYDGTTYVLDEYAERKRLVPENAAGIKAMIERNGLKLSNLTTFHAGHDCFAQRGVDHGQSISDEYAENGIYLQKANVDRISGAAAILKLLGDPDRPERNLEPKVKIAQRCTRLIETLPAMEHDPKRPEDVLKVDIDEEGNGGDDAYDAFRYGIMANVGPIMVI